MPVCAGRAGWQHSYRNPPCRDGRRVRSRGALAGNECRDRISIWEDGLDTKTILVSDDGPIRTITLNRPQRRNAMTPEMQMELISTFEETAQSGCRVVVLSGAGDAFCAGLDLSALEGAENET